MNTTTSVAFPATGELSDGTRVTIRPLVPGDASELLEGFARLSPRSRRQRFHCGIGHLNRSQLEFLTHPDQTDHLALCMQTEPTDSNVSHGIGVARCVRTSDADDVAEVAVTVVDQWQGRGAGRLLLRHLATRAWEMGIRYWEISHFSDNRAVSALIAHHATVVKRDSAGDGVIDVICSLSNVRKEQMSSHNSTMTTTTA
ncbi:MAG: GNAT family N-acetyltransferase [Deltaproteobacteria bacterium]|nr:GNAT family N-acetyltransferase [Deltaproteobacteria bacterium]